MSHEATKFARNLKWYLTFVIEITRQQDRNTCKFVE